MYYEDLKEAGYDPYQKEKAAAAENRRFTEENRKRKKTDDLTELVKAARKDPEKMKLLEAVQFRNLMERLLKDPNLTLTENRALMYRNSGSSVVDLFACVGGLRRMNEFEILRRFYPAWIENRDFALKILFYARDVRGGQGERRVFRTILSFMAELEPETIRKNIGWIPVYGRFDNLLVLLGTPCEADVLEYIRQELEKDMAALEAGKPVSLLAKWLPSINASSFVTRQHAITIARGLGITDSQYRRMLSALRRSEQILENDLREKAYHFDYSKQPSRAMFKYRRAFFRHDRKRYSSFLEQVERGEKVLHAATVMPYDLVHAALGGEYPGGPQERMDPSERKVLDVTWKSLPDYTDGRNALVVVDGSGSMYGSGVPCPGEVALSLGIYFGERNTGMFNNRFITFSSHPRLVEIKGGDFTERVRYCSAFNECSNTDITEVFMLILEAAVNNHVPQSEMPETIYIISDMEFDYCARNAGMTNFEYAEKLYEENGYRLPNIVFWNVESRHQLMPVRMNKQGVALVSGSSPQLFTMVMKDTLDPYRFMLNVIDTDRYAPIHA